MHLLWQIVDEGVLGASRHVRLTMDLLTHLIGSGGSPAEGWMRMSCAAELIAETRGSQAPTIANSIRMILHGLERTPPEERRSALVRRIAQWQEEAERRQAHLVASAVEVIGRDRTLIAFDYSSTVAAIVGELARTAPPEQAIVPESRAIAGGRPYLEAFAAAGIPVRYVVDAAFEHILGDNAVVLLGAERLRPDGSLTNTIGSRPLARLAHWRGCPVYGCSDLLKLDARSDDSAFAEPPLRNFDQLLEGIDLPDGARVTTSLPELEVVPASLITAYLTDRGPISPSALRSFALQPQKAGGVEQGE